MKCFQTLKKLFLGPLDLCFYKENKEELLSTNYTLLLRSCRFASAMCLALFCLTLVNSMVQELSQFYFVYTLLFTGITSIVRFLVSRHRQFLSFFFYLFAAATFFLVIAAGTHFTPNLPAVTFHVFLLIVPILYVTRPVHSVLLTIAACLVFCLVTIQIKGAGSYLAQTDLLNAVCCAVIGIGLDLTIMNLQLENIRAKVYFKQESSTDELTGLPNRRRFDLYTEKLFGECVSLREGLFILMMDIDNFKSYNDTYGHIRGDECLRRVGQALAQTAKIHGVFLARFGGEEFVAVADRMDAGELADIADRLVKCVEELNICHKETSMQKITISAGYAGTHDVETKDYMVLLDRADTALYKAKAAGKNQAQAWKISG